jgi:hypothetical protein
MFIKVLTTPILIVSSADIAFDLMDKRSAIYSDRPTSVMDELCVTNAEPQLTDLMMLCV